VAAAANLIVRGKRMTVSFRWAGRRPLWIATCCLLAVGLIWVSGVFPLRPRPGKVLGEYHSTSIDDTELAYFTQEGGVVLMICTDFTVC